MRRSVVMFSLFLAIPAFAKDVYFPIAGSTSSLGNFRTDVRLFNPSSSKDITVTRCRHRAVGFDVSHR